MSGHRGRSSRSHSPNPQQPYESTSSMVETIYGDRESLRGGGGGGGDSGTSSDGSSRSYRSTSSGQLHEIVIMGGGSDGNEEEIERRLREEEDDERRKRGHLPRGAPRAIRGSAPAPIDTSRGNDAEQEDMRLFSDDSPLPEPSRALPHQIHNHRRQQKNQRLRSDSESESPERGMRNALRAQISGISGGGGKKEEEEEEEEEESSSEQDASSSSEENGSSSSEEDDERGRRTTRERRQERRNREQQKKANQSSKSPPSTRTKRSSRPTMADELPTEVTRMVLTVLFERFDRNSDENIDVDEFQRLISSCNARRCKRRRPKKEDVLPLLQALDVDGDGRIQLDEFEGWVTKGFHMNLRQLEAFSEKGMTEAMLVDFLLSLRADVKGVMRRITSSIRRYASYGCAGSDVLDSRAFAAMVSSSSQSEEEKILESETMVFLTSSVSTKFVRVSEITSLFCRGIINRGLSIQGRGQQKHRRAWVLVRRKGLRMVDAELDQLLDEDEEENYVGSGDRGGGGGGSGSGGGKESAREGKAGGDEDRSRTDVRRLSPASGPPIAVTPLVSRQRGRTEQRSLKVTPIVTQRKHHK